MKAHDHFLFLNKVNNLTFCFPFNYQLPFNASQNSFCMSHCVFCVRGCGDVAVPRNSLQLSHATERDPTTAAALHKYYDGKRQLINFSPGT